MRELDCDFCGATAAGAYEVLPASLDPTPDEQVRVVLCGDCRETLDGVVAPLLARLGDGAADGGSVAAGPPEGASAGTPASGTGRGSGSGGSGSVESEPRSGSGPESRADTDYDAQADARSGGPDSPSDDAVIIDASKRGPDAEAADESDDVDAGDDGSTDANAEGADDSPTDSDTDPSEEPEGFRQVMRLLGNREFPVDRAEVVDLAGSAYDLDRSESDRIIDYAVENDVLEEDDGELQKA